MKGSIQCDVNDSSHSGACSDEWNDISAPPKPHENTVRGSDVASDQDDDLDDVLNQPPSPQPHTASEPNQAGNRSATQLDGDGDYNHVSRNVMLSLLARREVEHRTRERRVLQTEKARTRQFKRRGLAVDQNNSLEHTLALVETIPMSSQRLSNHHLPGGRGMDAPQEDFLLLANDISDKRVEPFEKLYNGKLPLPFMFTSTKKISICTGMSKLTIY